MKKSIGILILALVATVSVEAQKAFQKNSDGISSKKKSNESKSKLGTKKNPTLLNLKAMRFESSSPHGGPYFKITGISALPGDSSSKYSFYLNETQYLGSLTVNAGDTLQTRVFRCTKKGKNSIKYHTSMNSRGEELVGEFTFIVD